MSRKIIFEHKDEHGRMHAEEGPAGAYEVMIHGAVYQQEVYYRHGQLHNTAGPAVVLSNEAGEVTAETYYREGLKHREDGPAHLEICDNLRFEIWYRHGKLHHPNGEPAFIKADEEGIPLLREYYLDGQLHRIGGPAIIGRNFEEWYRLGRRHSLVGPSIIKRGFRAWHIDGKEFFEEKDFKSAVRRMDQSVLNRLNSDIDPKDDFVAPTPEVMNRQATMDATDPGAVITEAAPARVASRLSQMKEKLKSPRL